MGYAGAPGNPTPAIDGLGRDGVIFEQAVASVPLTLPSHSTIFTGTLPPTHGVRDNGGFVLDPRHVTLAERLENRRLRGRLRARREVGHRSGLRSLL